MAIYQGNKKLAYSCNVDNSVYAVPIGTILSYASATPPNGFLVCDGSEVSKTTYADLFEIIGDTYGKCTDTTKFKLPDLRETVPVGIGKNTTQTITNHDVHTLGQFKDDNVRTLVYADNNKNFPLTIKTNDTSHKKNSGMIISTESAGNEPSFIVGTGNAGSTHGKQLGVNYIIKALKVSDKYAEEVGALIDDSSTTATDKVYSVNKIMELLTDWQNVTLNEEVNDTVTVKKLKIGNIVYMHTHIAGLRYTGQGGEGTIIFSTNDTDVINTNITDGDKLRGIVDVDDTTNASNIVRTTANIDYDPTLGTFRLYCLGETTQQVTNVALYGDIFSIIHK